MTIEDVDWILRFPSDELVLSQESLNQVEAAIAASRQVNHRVVRKPVHESSGRRAMVPDTLSGRKLTIVPGYEAITMRVKGRDAVSVHLHL